MKGTFIMSRFPIACPEYLHTLTATGRRTSAESEQGLVETITQPHVQQQGLHQTA